MDLAFYQWFLRELIEALRPHAEPPSRATTVITSTAVGHLHRENGDILGTPGQSILNTRPDQPGVIVTVGGRTYTLGDGKRVAPPLLRTTESALPPPRAVKWLPPLPVMPPQVAASSVAWDGPPHAAHAYYAADDGMWDLGWPRETGTEYDPPLLAGTTPVEVTGVFPRLGLRRCLADIGLRPEHAATDDRYNLRLPVMAGVDAGGRYLRIVSMPMKAFEYREV